ncbi:protein translocase subunit SecD [Neorhodopirellula pilleata]|uniref:Multifunctional fusion protein n=1 Tax=Neorhodopirellula pilleata TaxID=2714738 RepID=A0A5C6AUT1_9BACT|nr:protein translocase subunit SecD [Neorhodopirellula pilleata]TWU03227.1 bifunctional preprotein translocase subunit SecD/SecF [Neorhodopirellula pilleata]
MNGVLGPGGENHYVLRKVTMDLPSSLHSLSHTLAIPVGFAPSDWSTALLAQTNSAVAGEVSRGISGQQWVVLLVAAAILILPFIIGSKLAKGLKMPGYGTRFGFIMLAIIGSGVTLWNKLPGLGVDLQGGTILVYEIDPDKQRELEKTGSPISSKDLVEPLTRRINPSGTQEIVIRPYGESQIEIIVPAVDDREVARIKKLVSEAGVLRFAILANQVDHQAIISTAFDQAESDDPAIATDETVGTPDDGLYGRWVKLGRETKEVDGVRPLRMSTQGTILRNPNNGEILNIPQELLGRDEEVKIALWMKTQSFSEIEVLMIINPLLDIKGDDLSYAASTFDEQGGPAVAFNLTDFGSGRFRALTTNNSPEGTRKRQLGIILDDTLLSAPNILQPISKEGRITGNFTREEVDGLVQILKAGQLPATVTKQPIAENQIDATLGKDTIEKGVFAIGLSLAMVLVFILYYYRFAGVVACIALIMNLAMILATMVFINQPMTLPGLAGLVLTVGMSVDANVLIFERIREELKKGAKERMAVRNGFARATTTIIDANLTTLITAIVLYAIGTDQIRGFAVTLILGIGFSMFTAIYVSRTIFDLAERRGWLSLSMADTVNSMRAAMSAGGEFDFIARGKMMLSISLILVIGGVAALISRGQGIFDIDFAGGSSVQFRVDSPTETEEIRRIVAAAFADDESTEKVQFTVNGVSMDGVADNTIFKVDSSVDQVDTLKTAIQKGFAKEQSVGLSTYKVSITPTKIKGATTEPPAEATSSIAEPNVNDQSFLQVPQDFETLTNGTMLTVLQAEDAAETPASEAPASAATDATEMREIDLPGFAFTTSDLALGVEGSDKEALINEAALLDFIKAAAADAGIAINERGIRLSPLGDDTGDWDSGSALPYSSWRIQLPLEGDKAIAVMKQLEQKLGSDPVWISSSSVGAQVAGDMIGRAAGALFASLLCIIGYIWFRFQRVIYGFAAVVALLHDVLITLGAIAISYWVADALGFLLIDPFKISLTVVAALLTIIGYSLNDTIVVFDRIRETKGKAPRLTGDMINSSINQTLSRTLLTSVTTLIVVVLLYALGGEGIHAFAFALVVGVVVGTYSSVFIASPILLMLVQRNEKKAAINS